MKPVAFLTLTVVGVAGAWGYYYYQEFYIPSIYAAEVVPLYQTVPHAVGILHSFSPSEEEGFLEAGNVLHEQCNALNFTKQQLVNIQPAPQGELIHHYFQETLDVLGKACGEAITKVEHMGSLITFLAEFEKIFTIEEDVSRSSNKEDDPTVPRIRTVGDLQRIWGGQMKAAAEAGTKAFGGNLTDIDEKTADTLSKEWERIEPNLAAMMSVLENLNLPPSLSIEEVGQRAASSQLQAAEKAMRELTKSRDALTKIRGEPEFSISALDIVSFRSLKGVSQAEISEHLYTLDAAIKELDARY